MNEVKGYYTVELKNTTSATTKVYFDVVEYLMDKKICTAEIVAYPSLEIYNQARVKGTFNTDGLYLSLAGTDGILFCTSVPNRMLSDSVYGGVFWEPRLIDFKQSYVEYFDVDTFFIVLVKFGYV